MARRVLAAAAALLLAAPPAVNAQADEAEMADIAPIPEGYFNAALGKPAVADSEYSATGSCPEVNGGFNCVASLAVDGWFGNEHRWLSAGDQSLHWIIIDLGETFWITTANIFAGYDADSTDGALDMTASTDGICGYDIQYYVGRVPDCGVACPEQFVERRWRTVVHVDPADDPHTMESHDAFAPTRGRFWRLKIDLSSCAGANNIARVFEIQLLAPIPGLACEKQVTVRGAGAPVVNGIYYEDGTSNGATRYARSGSSMALLSWPDGMWYLTNLMGGGTFAANDDFILKMTISY